jgi:hypothetical protein
MSSYTPSSGWAGKDTLSDSDPLKVISGAEFATEFGLIQTAVNTKANLNGAATETFSAVKAASGTDTTQVATTSFVKTAIAAIPAVDLTSVYPIGSVYMNATSGTNPVTLLGMTGTTWVEFGEGRMLLGENSSHANGSTGGSETHTLTIAEMPAHTHSLVNGRGKDGTTYSGKVDYHGRGGVVSPSSATNSTGGGTAFNIMNPYITVYMWKRTA